MTTAFRKRIERGKLYLTESSQTSSSWTDVFWYAMEGSKGWGFKYCCSTVCRLRRERTVRLVVVGLLLGAFLISALNKRPNELNLMAGKKIKRLISRARHETGEWRPRIQSTVHRPFSHQSWLATRAPSRPLWSPWNQSLILISFVIFIDSHQWFQSGHVYPSLPDNFRFLYRAMVQTVNFVFPFKIQTKQTKHPKQTNDIIQYVGNE